MDLTASIMCMEQKMPMLVFGLDEKDSIVNTVHGKFSGTKVTVIKRNNKNHTGRYVKWMREFRYTKQKWENTECFGE